MIPPANLSTGYYRVRSGCFPSGAPHWLIARWRPNARQWSTRDSVFEVSHFDEIAEKVA